MQDVFQATRPEKLGNHFLYSGTKKMSKSVDVQTIISPSKVMVMMHRPFLIVRYEKVHEMLLVDFCLGQSSA
jgi:hypothetical protein